MHNIVSRSQVGAALPWSQQSRATPWPSPYQLGPALPWQLPLLPSCCIVGWGHSTCIVCHESPFTQYPPCFQQPSRAEVPGNLIRLTTDNNKGAPDVFENESDGCEW
jgi:hypothetical protein